MTGIKILKTEKGINQGLEDLFRELLQDKILDGIIIPKSTPENKFIYQVLHKDPEKLSGTFTFSPVMPSNSATLLKNMTKLVPSDERIGIVLKPCEMRAVVELVKLKQINLENIYLFTVDCAGTVDIDIYSKAETDRDMLNKKILDSFNSSDTLPEVRTACGICSHSYPADTTDIGIGLFGSNTNEVYISFHTEKGKEIVSNMKNLTDSEKSVREKAIQSISEKKDKIREEYLNKFKSEVSGIEKLTSYFSKCINCHNCKSQCPICFCRECFFESETFDYESEQLLTWADRSGMLKMPTDLLLFHLGRMNHMVSSCIGCGMCSQACPVGIDVGSLFLLTGRNAQTIFNYEAGRSFEEELPISTFREEELTELGE
ncbi:MAG: 4Fe-4S dicluster domain-containing protein [bacterium]|nr:4Fe-4S dicluster domain-containing protein [bacterium]